MAIVDLHCHILPGIDDGSRNLETTRRMLLEEAKQGVDAIFATSHYYPSETAEEFLNKRQDAYQNLLKQATDETPAVLLGAEVYYHPYIAREDDIEKLCLGGSKYMLLELPFKNWSDQVFDDIDELINMRHITPVIAHLERYFDVVDKGLIRELRSLDVLIQMNAEYIIEKETRRQALKLIKKGLVDCIGTDSHGAHHRVVNLRPALDILEENGLKFELNEILSNNEMILQDAIKALNI